MPDKEKLARLIELIKNIVPYVTATIAPNNTFDIKELRGVAPDYAPADWIGIHKGRAHSSYRQLESLLKRVEEIENA